MLCRGDTVRLRIRDIREDNDIKQIVLARLLRISQPTYSKYEQRGISNTYFVSCRTGEILWHKHGLFAWIDR